MCLEAGLPAGKWLHICAKSFGWRGRMCWQWAQRATCSECGFWKEEVVGAPESLMHMLSKGGYEVTPHFKVVFFLVEGHHIVGINVTQHVRMTCKEKNWCKFLSKSHTRTNTHIIMYCTFFLESKARRRIWMLSQSKRSRCLKGWIWSLVRHCTVSTCFEHHRKFHKHIQCLCIISNIMPLINLYHCPSTVFFFLWLTVAKDMFSFPNSLVCTLSGCSLEIVLCFQCRNSLL